VGLRLTIPRVWQLFLERQGLPATEVEPVPAVWAVSVGLEGLPSAGPRLVIAEVPQPASLLPRQVPGLSWSPDVSVLVFQQLGAPGDVHLVVAGASPNMLRDLEEDLPDVGQLSLPPPSLPRARSVPWAVEAGRVVVGLPAGARLRITDIVSIEPSRVRRWVLDPEATPDSEGRLPLRGPAFVRYN
jgi:hypothetical protein